MKDVPHMDWFDQQVTIITSDTENHYTWCQDYPLPYQDTTIISMQHQQHEASKQMMKGAKV